MAYNQVPGATYTNEHVGQLILGVRKDDNAVSQVSGNNLYHPFLFDTAGNLRVGVQFQSGGAGASTVITSASNVISVQTTSSTSSIQVWGTVTATGVSVTMGPVGVTGGNINIVSANNIISITSTGLLGVILTSSNSSIQVWGTVTATGVSVTMGPVGVTGGNINILSANAIQSITSTGMLGITSTVLGVNISTVSNIVTVSQTNAFIGINTASTMLSITSTGLIGVTGPVLGVNITTNSNLISITHTGYLLVSHSGFALVSVTNLFLGITHSGYMMVSNANPSYLLRSASNMLSITSTGLIGVTGPILGVNLTTASNVISVNTTSSTSSIQVWGTVTATGVQVTMGPVGVTGGNINIVSVNNIISITSTGYLGITSSVLGVNIVTDSVGIGGGISFGEGTTSTNVTGPATMFQRTDNVMTVGRSDNSGYQFINLKTSSNIITVSAINSSFILSSAAAMQSITSTILGVNIATVSNIITVSSVNNAVTITTASVMQSITSTGLIGITGPVFGVNLVTSSNILTVSHTNASYVISSASAILSITSTGMFGVTSTVLGFNLTTASVMQSITSTGLIGITGPVLGVNLTTASNIITVSHTNAYIGINTGSVMLSITSTGLIGVTGPVFGVNITTNSNLISITHTGYITITHTGYMVVSANNAAIYSVTVTNRDGTFVVSPYTTVSGYFSTTINIATSAANKAIKAAPAQGNIYITHIKASTESPTNYWLVEDTAGTKNVIWGVTYLADHGGENATLVVPITVVATKDLGLAACCTNFSLNIAGYIK